MKTVKSSFSNLQFVLGGARSGKSRMALNRALQLATDLNVAPVFIATAMAHDEEMRARIKKHQRERNELNVKNAWLLVEEPVHLADAMIKADTEGGVILVDCLTLWISNCLHGNRWEEQQQKFLDCLEHIKGSVIFVSNETGLGIVPMGELTRQYVDASGFFHQQLAERCGQVIFAVAGLPQILKDEG